MLQEVIDLEKLRQQVERVENQIGSLSDYLDRGKPSEQQQQQTAKQIAAQTNHSAALQAQLHDRLAALRASQPHVIEQWVQWHREICQRIMAETDGHRQQKVRQMLAGQTLEAWKKVLRGNQDTVLINWYFLDDYGKEVARAIRAQQRRWWKFWI